MIEIFVSVDIEADGPIPSRNSMLSLGAAAFKIEGGEGVLVDTFTANLKELPGAVQDPETMIWWEKNPKAWEESRKNLQSPARVMREFSDWLKSLPGKVVFVGYPAPYDFMFVYWYLMYFTKSSPFGYNGLDIRSYAMGHQRFSSWRGFSMNDLFKKWPPREELQPHLPLDDAIRQGELFCQMLIESREDF